MTKLVSPCCGAEYNDDHMPISNCCAAVFAPETDICSECFEHADFYTNACNQCDEVFEEPETEYEYKEKMKESIAEDRMDEARDMGE